MKKNYLKTLVCLAAMAGVVAASAVSTYGCWLWTFHQRECPKALIRED
ncbi:MAG: cyclic lactone autoinducer peptide [Clostridiaceae bacterium]|jgi:cyclic lactone autoinducer peptide|nr:cyclic lactone autoinducer peptide [Clostridiaceae bacterium]